jgi:hypothetical protein
MQESVEWWPAINPGLLLAGLVVIRWEHADIFLDQKSYSSKGIRGNKHTL